jgi:uncharacterized secreted protein with C-terminal beta-propeller domain
MVQKEVAKKTKTYGLVGILLAVILVATIYTYGTVPIASVLPSVNGMQTFASYDELKDFLNNTGSTSVYGTSYGDKYTITGDVTPTQAPTAALSGESQTNDYSTTNIQVAGVDEADTIKTDGQYLYVIGNNSQVIYILDANPQNAQVLAKIWLNNSYLSGIYLSSDGSRLAVLGNQYVPYNYVGIKAPNSEIALMPWFQSSNNFVYVYNVQNKAAPVLVRNFTMSGSYTNSRMIGNCLYDIVTENAFLVDGVAVLPTVFTEEGAYNIAANSIYYANTTGSYYSYTTISAIDIMNDAAAPTNMTIMMGNAGNIYVSQNNIYVTYPVINYETITNPTPDTTSTVRVENKTDEISILPMPITIRPVWQGTAIYRIQIAQSSMIFAAQGNVTGSILSQYSMDEYNGYFRIATTSYDYNSDSWMGTSQNNLYVLNSDLKVVGQIEDLASGETLHAARFMGTRCYLVTFEQVDPLFVVDLTVPTNPVVLGNLTIPGYSDFLQPYDATHLIGIGQEVDASIDADKVHEPGAVYYTAILGLKVALFDVSDVAHPQEISKVVIGDRGTTSEAQYDAKAILFDAQRNLLVLPVDLYQLVNSSGLSSKDTGIVPPTRDDSVSSIEQYPQFVWQGAYIFDVSVDGGIVVQGNVSQLDNAAALLADPSLAVMSSSVWMNYDQFITRSMYIGNVLYTFSQSAVQLNSLSDFSLIAKVALQ